MLTSIKVYACYTVKIYKPPKNFKRGGARPVRRSWIRLWYMGTMHVQTFYLH